AAPPHGPLPPSASPGRSRPRLPATPPPPRHGPSSGRFPREHTPRTWATPEQGTNVPSGTKRDSDKRLMTGVLTAGPHLWRQGGGSVALIRRQRHPCPR